MRTIPRVRAPSPDEFQHNYLPRCQPAIFVPLTEGRPATRLQDRAVLLSELADMPLAVRPNYVPDFGEGRRDAPPRATTLGAFLSELEAGSKELCVEYATPAQLVAHVPLPQAAGNYNPQNIISHTFLAGPGAFAHLHYDADLRPVLMYQVFGRKRYVLIDPEQTRKLDPLLDVGWEHTSSLFLQHFSEEDRNAFLHYVNAWDCTLEPGETLFVPALIWHYIEYLDVALSVNFRLPCDPKLQFVSDVVGVRSPYAHALAAWLAYGDAPEQARARVVEQLREVCEADNIDEQGRAAFVEAACWELCAELGLNIAGPEYTTHERLRRLSTSARIAQSRHPAPRPWSPSTRASLKEGAELLAPQDRPEWVLVEGGRLVGRLGPDPAHPWTLSVMGAIGRDGTASASELAANYNVPIESVCAFLSTLEAAGWVQRESSTGTSRGEASAGTG